MDPGTSTVVDVAGMDDTAFLEYARASWKQFGGGIPEQIKEPLEPIWYELVARVERYAGEGTPA